MILKGGRTHVKVKVSYHYKLTDLININRARSKRRGGVGTLFEGRSMRELERGIREIENHPPLLHVYLVARRPPRVG